MTSTINNTQVFLKTRRPFNIYLLGLIMIVLTIESFFYPAWIVYSIPLYAIFYVIFCRYCCIVLVTEQSLNVYYITPWNKNLEIRIADIKKIEYFEGFYHQFSGKPIGGLIAMQVYCHDKLVVDFKDTKQSPIDININTRIFDFGKILNVMARLKLLDKK